MDKKDTYIAITGDIINSRNLSNRDIIQKRLDETLTIVNKQYESDIVANFILYQGDEFQGLLMNGNSLLAIINVIQTKMFPVTIRFGIGIGKLTTNVSPSTMNMDGPAYHFAREAIEYVKSCENKRNMPNPDIWLVSSNACESNTQMLNTIFVLMKDIKSAWTDRQREVINCYKECGESQVLCAQIMNVTQSAVNQHLMRSHYQSYHLAERTLQAEFSDLI